MNTQIFTRAAVLATSLALFACASPPSGPYVAINHAARTSPVITHSLPGGVSMLEGSGGNIAVLATDDGLLLVDTGIAVSERKIANALSALSPLGVRYAVNTHWHWDHTDGNSWVRRSGAAIIADTDAVARLQQTLRIEEWNHTFTPISNADLPNRPISEDLKLPFGGETALIRRYSGHTDGDLSVYFVHANVLVTGDTFWNGMYPFIDYVAGGGIEGAIREAEANLAMAGQDTVIIPGHGPLAHRADAQAFRDMLVEVRNRVAALKAQGMSLAEAQAARPTADLDERWGRSLISGELFTALVYRGV